MEEKEDKEKGIYSEATTPGFMGGLVGPRSTSRCPAHEVDMVTRYYTSVSLSASPCPSTIQLPTSPLLPINPAAKSLSLPFLYALSSNSGSRPGTIRRA